MKKGFALLTASMLAMAAIATTVIATPSEASAATYGNYPFNLSNSSNPYNYLWFSGSAWQKITVSNTENVTIKTVQQPNDGVSYTSVIYYLVNVNNTNLKYGVQRDNSCNPAYLTINNVPQGTYEMELVNNTTNATYGNFYVTAN